ncbi:hypothetical protein [Nocardia terpenica]|uniref:hypothetical protein n=1 Tax=Nocardia terpenica TaxID=455432 RepID=UPI0002F1B36E|nr:hypothetical protein [Nocardia terpenica]NQE91390.1 hypothetical protein [Nocardia terpenica]
MPSRVFAEASPKHGIRFREFTRADEDKLADWLAVEVCPVELRVEQLLEAPGVQPLC